MEKSCRIYYDREKIDLLLSFEPFICKKCMGHGQRFSATKIWTFIVSLLLEFSTDVSYKGVSCKLTLSVFLVLLGQSWSCVLMYANTSADRYQQPRDSQRRLPQQPQDQNRDRYATAADSPENERIFIQVRNYTLACRRLWDFIVFHMK